MSLPSLSDHDETLDAHLGRARLIAVIPAYDEERFVGSVVIKARTCVDLVLVVDDGSTDDTAAIAEAAGARVIRHERNLGKAAALATGFAAALEHDPLTVVTLDADGQHRPEQIPILALPILRGEADVVVGSRYLEPRSRVPWHRILGHRALNFLNHAATGIAVSDSQSGFRAFSPRALRAMRFSSQGFSVETEMQFLAADLGLKVGEVAVQISYPDGPKRSVVVQGLQVLDGTLRLIGQYRPLLYLGLLGVVLLLTGFGWGVHVVEVFRAEQTLAVGHAMISMLCIILGAVTLASGVVLHSVRGLMVSMIGKRDG